MSRHETQKTTRKKVTASRLLQMKQSGEKIAAITCYDAAFARILEESHMDLVLVGDSLGNVMLGHSSTIPVTMDDMVHHTAAVSRVLRHAFLVADMPFMSYQVSTAQALENAARLVQEGGAEAVKLEGGREVCDQVRAISQAGIPVVGHLGLTPQKIHALGGFKVQGRGEAGKLLMEEAKLLEQAGVCALVLELVPKELSRQLSKELKIPTIGIGAGVETDGQVLVLHDMLGFDDGFKPKFLKSYANLKGVVSGALESYLNEVKEKSFPDDEHSFE